MPERHRGQPEIGGEEKKDRPRQREKKGGTLHRLERRVLLVRDVYNKITAIRADIPLKKVAEQLDEIFGEILGSFPVATQKKFAQYQKARARYLELDTVLEDLSELEINEREQRENADPRYAELEKLLFVVLGAESDADLFFLLESANLFSELKKKKQTVEDLKDSREALSAYVPFEAIEEVFFNTFSVSLAVKADWLDDWRKAQNQPPTSGFHLPHTPVNIVRQDTSRRGGIEETIRHENIHNFLDSLSFFRSFKNLERWAKNVERYERLKRLGASGVILAEERNLVMKMKASDFLDDEHEEWLAAVENAENFGFARRFGFRRDFLETIPSLGTAQYRALDLVKRLKEKAAETKDDFLTAYLERMDKEVAAAFFQAADYLTTALGIGRRLSSEADDFSHYIFVLLKPSQFRFAEILLRHRYGEAAVDEAKERYLLCDRFDGSLEAIRQVMNLSFEGRRGRLDLKNITGQLEDIWEDSYSATPVFGIDTLEKEREYIHSLTAFIGLLKKHDLPAEVRAVEKVARLVGVAFFGKIIDNVTLERRSVDEVFFENLSDEEKDACFKAMLDFFPDTLSLDLAESLGLQKVFLEDVLASGFWRIAQLIGREEEIMKELQKYFKSKKSSRKKPVSSS